MSAIPVSARHKTASPRRSAFTLVELMVVVMIIAVLVAMLLPVISAARESARRVSCLNAMRQLALAVGNFESTHGYLPPAGLVGPAECEPRINTLYFNPRSGNQISWLVQILPYMEEQHLSSMIDPDLPITEQSSDPQAIFISSLVCPSDVTTPVAYVFEGKAFAKSNFAGFASPFRLETEASWAGAFGGVRPGSSRGQTMGAFLDGSSKTLLASEVRTRPSERDQRGAWALPWVGCSLLALNLMPAGVDPDADISDVRYVPSLDPREMTLAQTPNKTTGNKFDRLYQCEQEAALEEMPCETTLDGLGLYASPRSQHPGGVNALAVDGHAAFLANEVDPVIMGRLIAVADGELIK